MPLVTLQESDQLGEIVIDNPPRNLFSGAVLAHLGVAIKDAPRAMSVRCCGGPKVTTIPPGRTPPCSQASEKPKHRNWQPLSSDGWSRAALSDRGELCASQFCVVQKTEGVRQLALFHLSHQNRPPEVS
jgi:hypothetical protein